MANSIETRIILNYESENITIINDIENLVNYFIKFVRSDLSVEENVKNAFIFSTQASFDRCVQEATAIGLLPS